MYIASIYGAIQWDLYSDFTNWNFVGYTENNDIILTMENKVDNAFLRTVLPHTLLTLFLITCCIYIEKSYKKYIINEITTRNKNESYEKDLHFASKIQSGVLKTDFPERTDVEVYARTQSAKIVGGDFYDFFEIDENHLAIIIGDVSGKGLPAAMFMMNLKSIINAYAKENISVDKIFEKTNKLLCAENKEKMHATAWLGIFDTVTGELSYVTAGHNPPILFTFDKNKELQPNYLKVKTNFVLGRKNEIKYREHSINLKEGEGLILYTDGLVEAENDKGEIYGYDKCLEYMKQHKKESGKKIIDDVFSEIEIYEKGNLCDDLTMLSLEFKKFQQQLEYETIELPVNKENHDKIIDFIIEELTKNNLSKKFINNFTVCASELYSNIDYYGQPLNPESNKIITIKISISHLRVIMIVEDNCIAFNPFSVEKPVIQGGVETRKKGGLGIYFVKKMMNNVRYEYSENKNKLIIEKDL